MRSTEIIYGIHPVSEALRAGKRRFERINLSASAASSRRLQKLRELAESRSVPVVNTSAAELQGLSKSAHHQGVAAKVSPLPLAALPEILDRKPPPGNDRCLILLDNLTDPHNLGAIIRSALASGADAVLLPKDRAAGPTPAVSKASAGALEHTRLVRITNVAATMRLLRESGCWLYGLDPEAQQSVYEADLTGSVVLVVGGEEKGIRPLVKKNCDTLLRIPQSGPVASLNASVAAAVVMFEAFRQRLTPTVGNRF